MSRWHWTTVLAVALSSGLQAQLAIENPRHLSVPEPQAQALFLTTLRVMEKEFNAPETLENKFRMRLVLGEKQERFTIDDPAGNGTLYLERWNEFKFTATTMRLAIQQLLAPERQQRMMDAIVRRAHEIAPVSAADLRREPVNLPPARRLDDCMARMSDASSGGVPCKPGGSAAQSMPIARQ